MLHSLAVVPLLAPALVPEELPRSTPPDLATFGLDSSGSGTFTRSVAADLDGDFLPDLVTVRGGSVEVVLGPGLFGVTIGPFASANDAAVLPGAAASGADALVTVHAGGASLVEFVWDATEVDGYRWDVTALEDDDWCGAQRVLVTEVDGDASPRIYGVMQGSSDVRALIDSGSGYADPGAECFTSPDVIEDLVAFDRDDDDDPELACLVKNGVRVYCYLPTPDEWQEDFTLVNSSFGGAAIAAGSQSGATDEWLAFVVTDLANPTNEFLLTYDAAGTSTPHYLIGNPLVSALGTGDWNGDGHLDLVASYRTLHDFAVLQNVGDGADADFDSTQTGSDPPTVTQTYGPEGTSAPDNYAQPVFADFDKDGDNDVLMPVQSQTELAVWVNHSGGNDPWLTVAPIMSEAAEDDLTQLELTVVECTTGATYLSFVVEEWPPGAPGGANAIEAALWIWRRSASEEYTDPVSIQYARETKAAILAGPQEFNLDLEGVIGDADLYLWALRPCRVVNDEVVNVYAAQAFGMQVWNTDPPNSGEGYDILDAEAAGPWFWVDEDLGACNPLHQGLNNAVGTGVPTLDIINLPPGVPARVNRT